jgi:hypothetical protein
MSLHRFRITIQPYDSTRTLRNSPCQWLSPSRLPFRQTSISGGVRWQWSEAELREGDVSHPSPAFHVISQASPLTLPAARRLVERAQGEHFGRRPHVGHHRGKLLDKFRVLVGDVVRLSDFFSDVVQLDC